MFWYIKSAQLQWVFGEYPPKLLHLLWRLQTFFHIGRDTHSLFKLLLSLHFCMNEQDKNTSRESSFFQARCVVFNEMHWEKNMNFSFALLEICQQSWVYIESILWVDTSAGLCMSKGLKILVLLCSFSF